MKRFRFNHIVVGEIVESDVIEISSIEEWRDLPESETGAWSVLTDAETGRVLANRLVGIPVFGRHRLGAAAPPIGL